MTPTEKVLRISPSKLERIEFCPGSAALEAGYPWKDTPAALRGRSMHDALALLMMTGKQAWDQIRKDPNLQAADYPGLETAWNQTLDLYPDDDGVIAETESKNLDVTFLGLSGGRVDQFYYSPAHKGLVVIDWKSGAGEVEDPERNRQLQAYAAGLAARFKREGRVEVENIECVIIQPWAFREDDREHPRSHVYTMDELRVRAAEIQEIARKAKIPNAPLIAGKDQCRWCNAREDCRANRARLAEVKEMQHLDEQTAMASLRNGTPLEIIPEPPIPATMILLDAETVARSEALLAEAAAITVTSQETAQLAGAKSKECRNLINLVNKSREQVKKPVLELGRKIDSEAKRATDPLNTAANLLDSEVDAWFKEQERIAREAREAEERRIREAEEAEARARAEAEAKAKAEEDARRRQEEAERKAAEAKTAAARKKAEEAARKAREEAEALERARQEAERKANEEAMRAQVITPTAQITPPKIEGYRQAEEITWEIPDFTKIPPALLGAVLVPDKKTIDAWIKSGKLNEKQHGSWLVIKRDVKAARASR